MESPQTSKRKFNEGDTHILKVNCTPKNCKGSSITGEEFSLYNLHRESSPNFRAGQDVLEVGWGDSPEPLNVESKFEPNRTPVTCKKKLETKDSPKSSIPFKRRNVRSTVSIPSKSVVDIAKYVAEVQELSKSIMKEFSAQKMDTELFKDEKPAPDCKFVNRPNSGNRPSSICPEPHTDKCNSKNQNKDSTFENVLETFINEEDDWLSQALSSQEQMKTPLKGSFTKSKSENELTIPQPRGPEKNLLQNCRNINNNFRRTASFDLTNPTNSYSSVSKGQENGCSNAPCNQYSLQEIERKRLEAKYRKERREIERRKLEALKRLEMKKLRVIKNPKPSVIEIVNKI